MIEKTNAASRGSKGQHLSMTKFGGCEIGRAKVTKPKPFRNAKSQVLSTFRKPDAWLAQWTEHATLGFRVRSLSPTMGLELI